MSNKRREAALTPDEVLAAIIAHRELIGMTQRQAAANYGCKPVYWNMIERGGRAASLDVLVKMAEAVGLRVELRVVSQDRIGR